jgi:hypothetical protein
MRKPVRVTLTVVATVALACCGRRRVDPCDAATFHEAVCQQAVRDGGYFGNGSWHSIGYSHPYPYYYDHYRSYVSNGGTVVSAPGATYSHPWGSVARSGFGATGEAHGAGSHGGGHGAGE